MDDEYCVGTRCASKCTNVFLFSFFRAKNEKENGSFVFLLLFCSACRSLRGSSPLCETIHNLQDPINVFLPSGCTSVHVCTPVFPSYSSLQVASWNPSDFYCRYPGLLHNGASISKHTSLRERLDLSPFAAIGVAENGWRSATTPQKELMCTS